LEIAQACLPRRGGNHCFGQNANTVKRSELTRQRNVVSPVEFSKPVQTPDSQASKHVVATFKRIDSPLPFRGGDLVVDRSEVRPRMRIVTMPVRFKQRFIAVWRYHLEPAWSQPGEISTGPKRRATHEELDQFLFTDRQAYHPVDQGRDVVTNDSIALSNEQCTSLVIGRLIPTRATDLQNKWCGTGRDDWLEAHRRACAKAETKLYVDAPAAHRARDSEPGFQAE
jgi:hypothetical protein